MPAAGRLRANDRDVFGNFPANNRRGKFQAAASPELSAAYSQKLKRSLNLPMKSPISRGLQLKSHGSLFKGRTDSGPRPWTAIAARGCRTRRRDASPDPLWLQPAHYSGELSLRRARCMRPPWNGAFLQRNAGPGEFPCGRGFAFQRRRHPSADVMGQAPLWQVQLAKAVFRHIRAQHGGIRIALSRFTRFYGKIIPPEVESCLIVSRKGGCIRRLPAGFLEQILSKTSG
jgi:hypothetical protein